MKMVIPFFLLLLLQQQRLGSATDTMVRAISSNINAW
jgi:hypothetical protein